jgi:dCTP deaminase
MTVYSDSALRSWSAPGGVAPYDPAMINPASIDLRLGNTIRVPRWEWTLESSRGAMWDRVRAGLIPEGESPYWSAPEAFTTHVLFPGDFALCCTLETVTMPPDATGMLFLKSSAGRLGFEHLHAAYIDPGFSGTITLEICNVAPWPLELVAGMRIVQLALLRNDAAPESPYRVTGHYMGQTGPTVAWNEMGESK